MLIHIWVPDLIFPPALPWVHCAEVPVAVNHQILFSHYSENNYGLIASQRIVAFFVSLISVFAILSKSTQRSAFLKQHNRTTQNREPISSLVTNFTLSFLDYLRLVLSEFIPNLG